MMRVLKTGLSLALALAIAILVEDKLFFPGTFLMKPEAKTEITLLPEKIKELLFGLKNRFLGEPPVRTPESPPITLGPWPTTTPAPKFFPNPMSTPTPAFSPPPLPLKFTPTPTHPQVNIEEFARCLTQQGMRMYGTNTCGSCRYQMTMFGAAFLHINFVDCSKEPQTCNSEGITGYPTWRDSRGNKYPGAQSFDSLSQISGCPLPN